MEFAFQETQERFRNSHGKQAMSVRATEGPLYFLGKDGKYENDRVAQSGSVLIHHNPNTCASGASQSG